jgi:flagellar FliJ protein
MNPSDAPASVLELLLEQAEHTRDAALAECQRADAQARQALAQLDQLERYRQDYDARWGAASGRSGSVTQLQGLHGFMQRLEQALAQQRRQCDGAERRAAAAREALLARELRVAAVRKLLQRRAEAARQHAGRLAQRASDESAQRAAAWGARHAAELH